MLLKDLGYHESSISLLITTNSEIAELNGKFRNKPKSTDVLSFSMQEGEGVEYQKIELGDVVISLEKAEEQAREREISVQEELLRLLIHGVLHLVGYEHEGVSRAEALRMQKKEQELLDKLEAEFIA